jgi:ribonuclease BN (tRNA processing enzyme)
MVVMREVKRRLGARTLRCARHSAVGMPGRGRLRKRHARRSGKSGGSLTVFLVLLAGGGNTAHVFDELAPKLATDYHVHGITRRGFGASGFAVSDNPVDRLRDNVLAVLGALKLERPAIHTRSTMAKGPKMKEFQMAGPRLPNPGESDLSSFSSLQAWDAEVFGFQRPVGAISLFECMHSRRGSGDPGLMGYNTARQAVSVPTASRPMSCYNVLSGTVWAALLASGVVMTSRAAQRPEAPQAYQTKVVLLGTGTPAANPDRSGPATAIVVNDTAYLVDLGPGVVRRASAAAISRGITALQPTRLRVAFMTHLHSDHTVGYPDLILTPWTLGRRVPLEVYGPKGLKAMTEHLLAAYREDIGTRTNPDGNQRTFPDGYKVNAHEIVAGVVYKDDNVTVTAFATKHAMESYGYRFDTPDRSIVLSGDTNPTQATIEACRGCDVLIHEVHTSSWLAARPEAGGAPPGTFRRFSEKYHTTTSQLADLAREAKPRLLVLYHYNSLSAEELQLDMMQRYPGHFVIGRDLDVY